MDEKKVKVLLVNGSPRPNHNTGSALKAVLAVYEHSVEDTAVWTSSIHESTSVASKISQQLKQPHLPDFSISARFLIEWL